MYGKHAFLRGKWHNPDGAACKSELSYEAKFKPAYVALQQWSTLYANQVPSSPGRKFLARGKRVCEQLSLNEVLTLLLPLEGQLGRKINPNCYTQSEYAKRLAEPDSFINRILAQPTLPLIGGNLAASGAG
ncbi:hypothetical protein [Azonexus sp.]|uniref:hypothetical protein n=1 Tax=Azonexus sp. TaxID=1872668 RepID=UPI0035B1F594